MSDRADRTLAALWQYAAVDRTVCATSSQLAKAAGLSTSTVQHALADLVADGDIAPTGQRRGNTAVFRLLTEPRERVAPADQVVPAHTPKGGGSGIHPETRMDAPEFAPGHDQRGVRPGDTGEDDKRRNRVEAAEHWLGNAGLHYDRWEEVEEELFGDRGRLHPYRGDMLLRARMRALWNGHRPKGIRVEREELERAQAHVAARAKLATKRLRTPAALRDLDVATMLADLRTRVEGGRNGDRPDE